MDSLPSLYTLKNVVGKGPTHLKFTGSEIVCTDLMPTETLDSSKFYVFANLVTRLRKAGAKDNRVTDQLGLKKKLGTFFEMELVAFSEEHLKNCPKKHFQLQLKNKDELEYNKETCPIITQLERQIDQESMEEGTFYVIYDVKGQRYGYGITFRTEPERLKEYRAMIRELHVYKTWSLKWPVGFIAKFETAFRNILAVYRDIDDRKNARLEWFKGDFDLFEGCLHDLFKFFNSKIGPNATTEVGLKEF